MLERVVGVWEAIVRRRREVRGKIRMLEGARTSIMLKVMSEKWRKYASGELLEDEIVWGGVAGEGEGDFSQVARVLGDMAMLEDSVKAWKMSITVREKKPNPAHSRLMSRWPGEQTRLLFQKRPPP